MSNQPHELSCRIKALAASAGFDRCGIASAGPIPRGEIFREWLARGHAGTMGYLHRHADSRIDIRNRLPWARSVIVAALNYAQPAPPRPADEPRGRIAMYAWGEDYHVVIREKLETLVDRMRSELGVPFKSEICVDTSATIERELAAVSGVGWIGKNTLVMHESIGSYFFLGEIITDLDLAADQPALDHCGTCTRCLDACPTGAFPAPYQMDARRCISYLTIEHRGDIDPALAPLMGDWIFGCDICQEVCPHNRHAPETGELRFIARAADDAFPALSAIANWNEADCRTTVNGKASDRAKPHMWKRNAEIARANLEQLNAQPEPPSASADRSYPAAEARTDELDLR